MTTNPSPFPRTGDLIAADPSLNAPGAAWFRDGVLRAADRVRIPGHVAEMCIGARVKVVAAIIARTALEWGAVPRYLIVEWPIIYPGQRAKKGRDGKSRQVRPNDIVKLAGIAGAVVGMLSARIVASAGAADVLSPTPAEWIGQLPKSTEGDAFDSPRARLVLSCLTDAERRLVPRKHDAVDAVGLGLWSLGRLVAVNKHARPSTPGIAR